MSEDILKILVVGEMYTGKTLLINRLYNDKDLKKNTIGIDYRQIKVKIEDRSYSVAIWDTAGQEQYRSIVRLSCKGSDGVIIVYSVDDRQSLFRIDDWIRDLNENCPNAKKIIVANKIDLLAEDVDSKLLEQFLQKVDYPEQVFQTSALTGDGVTRAFQEIFKLAAQKKEREKVTGNSTRVFKSFTNLQSYRLTSRVSQASNQDLKEQNQSKRCC